jgi:hypothetical protein
MYKSQDLATMEHNNKHNTKDSFISAQPFLR